MARAHAHGSSSMRPGAMPVWLSLLTMFNLRLNSMIQCVQSKFWQGSDKVPLCALVIIIEQLYLLLLVSQVYILTGHRRQTASFFAEHSPRLGRRPGGCRHHHTQQADCTFLQSALPFCIGLHIDRRIRNIENNLNET